MQMMHSQKFLKRALISCNGFPFLVPYTALGRAPFVKFNIFSENQVQEFLGAVDEWQT